MAAKGQYNLWVLVTTVFLIAVILGWARSVRIGNELTPTLALIGPIYVAELIALYVFRWVRPNDAAGIRSFLILVLMLSGAVIIGVLMGW
jgi:hypothetical protein